MTIQGPTLCMPDEEKSCFACCPPIRPATYEHIQYQKTVERFLREDTRAFAASCAKGREITGFRCWALGYLDQAFRLVGCLLHPERHGGRDLRNLTGYGDKCRRETCPEARAFSLLPPGVRRFWLSLTRGMDAFAYSSRVRNPLFSLMGWGREILERVAEREPGPFKDFEAMVRCYPLFGACMPPRACAYLARSLMEGLGPAVLESVGCVTLLQGLLTEAQRLSRGVAFSAEGQAVHSLGMDPLYQDLLRLGLGIRRMAQGEALAFKGVMDKLVFGACRRGAQEGESPPGPPMPHEGRQALPGGPQRGEGPAPGGEGP